MVKDGSRSAGLRTAVELEEEEGRSTGRLSTPWNRALLVGFSMGLVPKVQEMVDAVLDGVRVTPAKPSMLERDGGPTDRDLLILAEQLSPRLEAFDWLRRLRAAENSAPAIVLVAGKPQPPPRDLPAVDVLPRRGLSAHDLARSLGFLRQSLKEDHLAEDLRRRLRALEIGRAQDEDHGRLLELAGAYRDQWEACEKELEETRARLRSLEEQQPGREASAAGPKKLVRRLEELQEQLKTREEQCREQETVLDEVRMRLGGGTNAELPERVSGLAARLMVAEWSHTGQVQNMQYLQQRLGEYQQQWKALAALLETPQTTADLDPMGLLLEVGERFSQFEKSRTKQQGTIDRLSRTLAVQQVDDTLDNAQSRRNALLRLDDALDASRRQGTPLACLLIAVDGAEPLREEHGSVVFDYLLVQIAQRLKLSLRQQDTLMRYDQESFVLITDAADAEAAHQHARRLVELVSGEPVFLGSRRIDPSISVAVALRQSTTAGGDGLVSCAQKLLGTARAGGRSQVVVDAPVEEAAD